MYENKCKIFSSQAKAKVAFGIVGRKE